MGTYEIAISGVTWRLISFKDLQEEFFKEARWRGCPSRR